MGSTGKHGDKLGRAMTFHFLIPVLPALPMVLTVHAIANRYKSSHSAPPAKLSRRPQFVDTSVYLTGQLFRARSGARLTRFTAGGPNISLGIIEGDAFGLPPSNYAASGEWPLILCDYRALFLALSAVVIEHYPID